MPFHLFIAHIFRKEGLASQRRSGNERIEAQGEADLCENERMPRRDPERGGKRPARRHGSEQNACGRRVAFQVLLDNKPAHRMPYKDWRAWQRQRNRLDVLNVVGDASRAKPAAPFAAAMSAQAHRVSREAMLREIIQEMGVPAPSAVPGAVNEKQRCRIFMGGWIFG